MPEASVFGVGQGAEMGGGSSPPDNRARLIAAPTPARYDRNAPGTRNVSICTSMGVLMAVKNTAAAAALADAFAALSVEGKPVTVRALRERARVSTDAASEWLRANRPARDVSPVPTEVLSRVLDPLWSAAVSAARDEQAEAGAAERAELVAAEADALTEVATVTARAEEAEAATAALRRELAALTDRLAAAETARDEQSSRAATAVKDAETARAAAHAAELLAAEAQATARTLREILDSVTAARHDGSRPPTDSD